MNRLQNAMIAVSWAEAGVFIQTAKAERAIDDSAANGYTWFMTNKARFELDDKRNSNPAVVLLRERIEVLIMANKALALQN